MAKDILKEAIADAKAVRQVALANAKAALEAFTPKLQSMLSAKLSEELDEDMYDEDMDEMDMDEMDMDEMDMDEMMTYDEDMEVEMDMDEMMNYDEDMDEDMYEEKGEEDSMDEEIDLEEILNELELEEGDEEEDEIEEAVGYPNHRADQIQKVKHDADDINRGLNETFNLDSLLKEINDLDETTETITKEGHCAEGQVMNKEGHCMEENKVMETKGCGCTKENTELNETKAALTAIKGELNEVNLLNSKLLYVNRIFKANNLNEAQKLRVVETLDNATNIKEAKLIYETIKDTFNVAKSIKTTPKKSIREGLGMASRAAGTSTARKKPILNESNDMVTRMQKLANISKIK
jgi:hypothetical protein